MVTHDAVAAGFGDRIIHIRDGRIESQEELATDARPVIHKIG
jgi:ABC-type lipoprotein export system ATPase subunit